jgi:hypothetical protein
MLAALPEDAAAFAAACDAVDDWGGLLREAAGHAVHGVIWRALERIGRRLPAEVATPARRRHAYELILGERLRGQLDQALGALFEAEVRTVALKGPLLAERIHDEPELRPSTDLDLLVASGDLFRAAAVLERLGYEQETGPTERYYREHHHHLHFHRRASAPVELHFRAYTGFGTVVAADALVAQARPHRSRGGAPAWVLAPADELTYLAVHLAGHLFARLAWLYDLKLFLRSHPELEMEAVAAKARQLGIAAAFEYALATLAEELAVPGLPTGGAAVRARLASVLLSATRRHDPTSIAGNLGRLAFLAALCDRPQAAAGFLSHHLVRVARRRAQRWWPEWVPEEWGG